MLGYSWVNLSESRIQKAICYAGSDIRFRVLIMNHQPVRNRTANQPDSSEAWTSGTGLDACEQGIKNVNLYFMLIFIPPLRKMNAVAVRLSFLQYYTSRSPENMEPLNPQIQLKICDEWKNQLIVLLEPVKFEAEAAE